MGRGGRARFTGTPDGPVAEAVVGLTTGGAGGEGTVAADMGGIMLLGGGGGMGRGIAGPLVRGMRLGKTPGGGLAGWRPWIPIPEKPGGGGGTPIRFWDGHVGTNGGDTGRTA